MKGVLILCMTLAIMALQGCGEHMIKTPVMHGQDGGQPIVSSESVNAALPNYVIQRGDELSIKFFYNPELNDTVVVRPDGRISLQLVHNVVAAGLTPQELEDLLTKKYATHLKKPEITVIVKSFEAQKVFVDGQVKKPGMIQMGGYMDLMQAIATAGGLMDTALDSQVLIIRRNGLKKPFIITVNIAKIVSGEDASQNVVLKPYDIIYVPKSRIAKVNTWVDLYLRKNIPFDFTAGVYRSLD